MIPRQWHPTEEPPSKLVFTVRRAALAAEIKASDNELLIAAYALRQEYLRIRGCYPTRPCQGHNEMVALDDAIHGITGVRP